MTGTYSYGTLFEEIDERAKPVGLERRKSPPEELENLPPGVGLWLSDYAVLLAWPIEIRPHGEAATEHPLAAARSTANGFLYPVLRRWDKQQTFRDAYVLFALSARPPDDWRAQMADLERDPVVCRKHVGYPDASLPTTWSLALDRVTLLSLPRVELTTGQSDAPVDPVDARVRSLIDESNSTVAEALRRLQEGAPKRGAQESPRAH